MLRLRRALFMFTFIFLLCVGLGGLREDLLQAAPSDVPAVSAVEEPQQDSPRIMLKAFLEAIKRGDLEAASSHLEFPRRMNSERRQQVTQDLMELINRKAQIDLAQVSDQATGRLIDGLLPDTEIVGRILLPKEVVPIELRRVHLVEEDRRVWRFASEFVDRVPFLWEAMDDYHLEDKMPVILTRQLALGLQAWQWIGIGLGLTLAFLTSSLLAYLLLGMINFVTHRLQFDLNKAALQRFVSPLRWLTGLLVFRILRSFLELPLNIRQSFLYIENVAFAVFITYLLLRIVDVMIELSRSNFEKQGRTAAVSMLQPIRKGCKVLVTVLAFLWILRALGFDVTAVIAGLGVGGLAIALAGQKTIENLFGGVSVILDQPVRVGDSGKFGDVIGTVEEIGLRSTKIRTLDRTILTIPNAEFSLMKLENYERRDKMRWSAQLGLRYETQPDQMRLVLMRLKELLIGHPMVLNDPARVRFARFGTSGLEVEIFCFVQTADLQIYWAIVEDLNLKIMSILKECGTGLAFPSTTVYLEKDSQGIDPELQQVAMEKAKHWADKNGFAQPLYPPEWVEPRVDTLVFGPEPRPKV